jgi:hypothetical protein
VHFHEEELTTAKVTGKAEVGDYLDGVAIYYGGRLQKSIRLKQLAREMRVIKLVVLSPTLMKGAAGAEPLLCFGHSPYSTATAMGKYIALVCLICN